MSHSTLARGTRFVAAALSLLLVPAVASASTKTFSFTGGEQTYTVPPGVTSLYITAIGARGGGPLDSTGPGGRGARVPAVISVTPGATLYVEVGGVGGSPTGG